MFAHPLLRTAHTQARLALGLFSHPNLATSARIHAPAQGDPTTFLLREASPTAPREVPTPLVFLSARQWEDASADGMDKLAAVYASRGYTTLSIDLAPPSPSPGPSPGPGPAPSRAASSSLRAYTHALSAQLRLAAIPWPPILLSRSKGCAIAQAYVEDYPARGLVLLAPPVEEDTGSGSGGLTAQGQGQGELELEPEPEPELERFDFSFEPTFPILIVDTPGPLGMDRQRAGSRLLKAHAHQCQGQGEGEGWVQVLEVGELTGQEAVMGIERWMDGIGV
ncbi:hypothetical protein CALCODRAFT_488089 [Calocera cornea HHB12733]|uniref:Serine aminopeptidase S33 domain-containing protein n=1 Tax=Calocera cornea HHB12733 TaxID=1353952 RepID=A0A165CRG6_9BASI|nr:hypothetical protein CALCODRAFT_488089 [Calocera cornea HHB12733]